MRKRYVSLSLIGAAIFVASIPSARAQSASSYVFTRIDLPGTVEAKGINNSGQVVGNVYDGNALHAFVRDSDGTITLFDAPGYSYTAGTGINDLGQIAGSVFTGGPSGESYVRNSDGTFVIFTLGFLTESVGINNFSVVSGTVEVVHNDHYDGFVRNSDGTSLLISPTGAVNTWARGINDAGQIVGGFQLGPNFASGDSFLRSPDGTFMYFSVPGAADSQAYGINSRGDIVGVFDYAYGGPPHGYLRNVDGGFTMIDYPGAYFTEALGINDAGQIVGVFNDGASQHGFLATPGGYAVCALYDAAKAYKAGSTIPIKLQLCDASGQNLSSPAVGVVAQSIAKVSSTTSSQVIDAGNANPDNNFRYDQSLAGYIFNLKTTGLSTGTYQLTLFATGDPAAHVVSFQVK